MIENIAWGDTLPEAYHDALYCLRQTGDMLGCSDYNTRQIEASMTIVCKRPIAEPCISKFMPCGPEDLQQYVMEITDGILDFAVDQGKWAYTYHRRIGEQLQFIINELRRNPESRRAVIDIRTPEDIGNPDPACLQHMQFFIRGGQLHMKVLMRSNDAWNACFMNMFAFVKLQEFVADQLGVKMGTYVHRANSFHVYEKDWENWQTAVKNFLEQKELEIDLIDTSSLAYNYEGDWKDMMNEAIPDILKKAERIKNNG